MQQATHRSPAARARLVSKRRSRRLRRLAVYLVLLVSVAFSTSRLVSGPAAAREDEPASSAAPAPAAPVLPASTPVATEVVIRPSDLLATDERMISLIVPAPYRRHVVQAAREFNLAPALLAALASVENSSWDPTLRGEAGEIGLVQVLPATQEEVVSLGLVEPCALEDPLCNLRTGAAYLAEAIRRESGDLRNGLRYYNGGPTWPEKPSTEVYADTVLERMNAVVQAWNRERSHGMTGDPFAVAGYDLHPSKSVR